MNKVYLKVPNKDDLKYCQSWMMDPDTMSYNAGYDIDLSGYNKADGTIHKSDEDMLRWYDKWINKEPERCYRYIYVEGIDEPIGEIYYYQNSDTYSMGILLQSKYRGKGYSYNALLELEKIAFEINNITELSDMIPIDRVGAIKAFKKAGFVQTEKGRIEKVFGEDSVSKELLITKEMYFSK